MIKKGIVFCYILFLVIITQQSIKNDIQTAYSRLQSHFQENDTKFKNFGKWQHLKGLYQSEVHLNIGDKNNGLLMDLIRRKLSLEDENMFVTSFVLYGLMQASQLSTISLDHHRFSASLSAIAQFKDKNVEFGLPQYSFWLQELRNGTWSAYSPNLNGVVDSISTNNKFLTRLLNLASFGLYSFGKSLEKVFCIPADIDDSSVNVILLGMMKEVGSEHYSYWHSLNFNLNKFYNEVVLKYAYRPFDPVPQNPRGNEIDPRSYYVLRKFLKKKKDEAEQRGVKASVLLPGTWLLSTQEEVAQALAMPFNVNNIDASVSINFLFGLLFQIHQGTVQPKAELRQMTKDTVDMIVYVIEEVVTVRPDILLLYYPSKYDFYWFVARTLGFLERADRQDDVLNYAYTKLSAVMRGTATDQLLKEKLKVSANSSYWAEFLGNYGRKNRNEDAIFSTALALNAFLDTWGVVKNSRYQYLQTIPSSVKSAINEGIAYLSLQMKRKQRNAGNVFFSGSIKTFVDDYPYIFPANLILDSKGKPVDPQTATLEQSNSLSIDCVKGYIEDDEYDAMLKLKWFQSSVPTTFGGYNVAGSFFPFWSSASITESMTLTALSKYYHTLPSSTREE